VNGRFRKHLFTLGAALLIWGACLGQSALAQDESADSSQNELGQATSEQEKPKQKPASKAHPSGMSGLASFYAKRFHGRKTSSGRHYDMHALTAAHRTLPFGTWVMVTNKRNGRSVVVEVIDRGPVARNRVIDLSWAAATKLGMRKSGLVPVSLKVVKAPEKAARSPKRAKPSPEQAAVSSP
jgi:rare lipoprotein A